MSQQTSKTNFDSLTMAELRELSIAQYADVLPLFDVEWPTVEEAKEQLELGFVLFGAKKNGGRAGMLASLGAAIDFLRASLPVSDLALLDPLYELHRNLWELEVNGTASAAFTAKPDGNPHRDAVAAVMARGVALSNILRDHRPCSQKDANKQAAALISTAAARAGIEGRIDAKTIEEWHRSAKRRRSQKEKSAAVGPKPFRRPSLATRVEGVMAEFRYGARIFVKPDGQLDLDGLMGAMFGPGSAAERRRALASTVVERLKAPQSRTACEQGGR